MEPYLKLQALQAKSKPIRVGIVGAGRMGSGLVAQLRDVPGITTVAVADIRPDRARKACQQAGLGMPKVDVFDTPDKADEWVAGGNVVIADRGAMLVAMGTVDIIVELTGIPEITAKLALLSILSHKPMVTLSCEADVTVGPILTALSRSARTVYTLSSGDEPGAILQLYEFAANIGLRIVVAGKGKNNPLRRQATPDECAGAAEQKGLNTKILTSFVDGSKTMVEMTAVANALGLRPDVPGMHGPSVNVKGLTSVFSMKAEGGILNQYGVVDFAIGDVAPGVFLISTTDQPVVRKDLAFYNMGAGPNYLLYRPYHLCSLEVPLALARAFLNNEQWIAPRYLMSEATTVAKRDLHAGELIDGIGGYMVRGGIETAPIAHREGMLPLGLVYGTHLVEDVPAGETLRYSDVELDNKMTVVQLRRLQDALFAPHVESARPLWSPGDTENTLELTRILNLITH